MSKLSIALDGLIGRAIEELPLPKSLFDFKEFATGGMGIIVEWIIKANIRHMEFITGEFEFPDLIFNNEAVLEIKSYSGETNNSVLWRTEKQRDKKIRAIREYLDDGLAFRVVVCKWDLFDFKGEEEEMEQVNYDEKTDLVYPRITKIEVWDLAPLLEIVDELPASFKTTSAINRLKKGGQVPTLKRSMKK